MSKILKFPKKKKPYSDKFLSGEIEVQYQDELKAPDGSPIGSYDNLLFACESEL